MSIQNSKLTIINVLEVLLVVGSFVILAWLVLRPRGHLIAPNGSKIEIQVRDTEEGRVRGLSNRQSLGLNSGMLFVFAQQSSKYCFWMKDMQFDLDIIWLNSKKEVVDVKYGARPESFPEQFCPSTDARYVLEIPAGQAAARAFVAGAQTKF